MCCPWGPADSVGLGEDGEGAALTSPREALGFALAVRHTAELLLALWGDRCGEDPLPQGAVGGRWRVEGSHAAPGAGPWAFACILNPTPPPTTLPCPHLWAEALHLVFRDDHLGDDDKDRGALGRRRRERENATVPI